MWIPISACALLLAVSGGPSDPSDVAPDPTDDGPPVRLWELFDLAELEAARADRGYREFLNVPSMTAGLYVLGRDSTDRQTPHDRDELYHVLSGRATLRIADQDHPVGPGSVVFVRRGVEHRFHEITEELKVLVVFAANRP